ncbi:retrovirus-related pol polyprotein from transposon TNT 1-94 [Tanacetum coccineum]
MNSIQYSSPESTNNSKWAERTILVSVGSSETTIEGYMENYKNVSQDIRNQLDAEAEVVQIIAIGIDNDIYSTVDACSNACEMWKTIERLKQGESINVQDLETNLYWEFRKFTSRDGESVESYYSRFYKMMNELVKNQCDVTNHQTVSYHKLYDILKQHQNEVNKIRAERLACTTNLFALVDQQQPVYHPQNHPNQYTQTSSTRSQQAVTRNRGKAIVNYPPPTYDQEPTMVAEDDEMSKEKLIDKLMTLISLSFKKIYKPTNNNLKTSSNTSRANQDNTPRINRGIGYDNQRAVNASEARENVGTQVVQQYGIQCYNFKEYGNVARECQKPKRAKDVSYHKENMLLEHPEQPESINDTYPDEQGDTNITTDSLDMSNNRGEANQDEDEDLARERDLLASLIEKLKCETDESKDRNKLLESSNKNLVNKLKSEIEDFKNKNKSLESSNNHFKERNTELEKNNQLMFNDLKKFQSKLDRYHDVIYASKVEIDGAKAKGDLMSYKMESQNSFNEYTRKFLKKAQRANPHLYDIGCYNDNLALMLTPESDETIRLAQENQSKLSDLIKPFDYSNLNNLYDLFVPQSEKSPERRYFSERTKMPMVVPISTREPKLNVNQSIVTPLKKTVVVESTNQKPRSKTRKQYKHISKTRRWWYPKTTPPGHKWKPKSSAMNVKPNVSLPLGKNSRNANTLESNTIRGSTLSKTPLTGNLKLLSKFVEKFLGTVKFRNDQIAPILGYGDLVQGNITIRTVYYVERLNHLFSVGQFYDADLEVAFRKSTCYIRDLKGNDLLTGSSGTNLYSITLQDTSTPNPICLMAKASSSQACWGKQNKYARTPEQNGVVERQNRTLIEAARAMLSAAKVPLFFWAEAIATACFTHNRSLVIPRHEETPYHIINGRKSSIKFVYVFGSLCYIVRDGENLDKIKEKVETIRVNFDELPQMASDHVSFDLVPQCPTTALEQDILSLGLQIQQNVPQAVEIVTTSNELDLLFGSMFDELLNGTTTVVSKSYVVTAADAPDQRQQHNTTPSTSTTVAADTTLLNIQTTTKTTSQAPTITATENINQA